MKKTFIKLFVIFLSGFMVFNNTYLPSYGEDISDYERNDIANSFRYTDGKIRENGNANFYARASVNSSWPEDSKAISKGIDVSYHNDNIDWKKVKQSEVEYAIIRCGYGINSTSQDDKKWEDNVKGCVDNNIPYGVYLYSYADTVEKASSEADHAIRLLEGKKLKYPIYYDLEETKVRDKVSKTVIGDIAETFCNKLSAKGYTVGIYANKDWFTNYLTDSRFNNWTKWVAQYNSTCTYKGTYDMWQCSSSGIVPGISGNVDLNYSYSTFEKQDNANNPQYSDGLNDVDGELYYFTNNSINTSYNGLASYEDNSYLVIKGKVDTSKSGLTQIGYDWYLLDSGKVNNNYTALYFYNNEWFYIDQGHLNWDYTGLALRNDELCYVEKGRLNTKYTGLVQYNNEWYYVLNGKVNWNYIGLAEYNNQWFYIENGRLNWNYTGLAQYNNQWFYIEKGRLNWNYTGLAQRNDELCYVEKGRLNTKYTGLVQYNNEWYYVSNGKVNWNYTGLVEYNNQWFYIDNGRLNWNYTGLAQYKNQWFYIENGRLNWNYTGLAQYNNQWFYIEKGRLNWNYTGLAQYNNDWFYISKGRLNWNYTGLVYHEGSYFYVEKGRLNWNYSGYAQINGQGQYYEVRNGRMIGESAQQKMRVRVSNESSPTQYIILVDRSAHRVGIFKGSKNNWQDAQYYKCCVGKPSTPTVSGTYYVGSRGKYFDTGSRGRCWYYTQITGNYLFHSVIYDRQSTPKNIIDNSMDAAVSHGCVRLDIDHAKWIYDNIPKNTKIIIY